MNRSWHFGDLEFVVLWEKLTGDFLPHPFTFTSRTPLYDDFQREKYETSLRMRDGVDAALVRAFESLAHPDIRVAVHSWDAQDPERAGGWIRLLAGRRGDRGCLVAQLPGETPRHSGGFTIIECHALVLADAVVAALPEVNPGGRGDIPLSAAVENHDHSFGISPVAAPGDDAEEHVRAFLRARHDRIGIIEIIQGESKFGPRGISAHRIEFRDLSDDGRYAVGHSAPWTAMSTDAARLKAIINTRIADIVRTIRDERC
ncbi:ESX secretion-associated protein EspG [Nocardia otitidiscaviarum]|uniref:ESX secretion-associated protein EspG n=1 Tax=Nocardia otitidiscaviarum TaxID=1823 RepID=UPI00189334D6|nr:ESX secretion-associated protein EspG [Nocardia otitidiscaviarum]MBF6179631.1 ESX secretion-associated protein EspG [Nocardia otitidiscaviarum]